MYVDGTLFPKAVSMLTFEVYNKDRQALYAGSVWTGCIMDTWKYNHPDYSFLILFLNHTSLF